MTAHEPYRLRPATEADIEDLLALRRLMCAEMDRGEPAALDVMIGHARDYMRQALPAGQMWAWVVEDEAGRIISNAIAVLRQAAPTVHNHNGREVYIFNVCTYPEHRRRGLARWLVETIMAWARAQDIVMVTLRASEQGRPLYESIGFRQTSEMRLRLEEGSQGQ